MKFSWILLCRTKHVATKHSGPVSSEVTTKLPKPARQTKEPKLLKRMVFRWASRRRTHLEHHIGMSRYGRQRSEETCQSGTGGVLKTHLVKQDLLYSQLLCPVAIAQETFAAANQLSGDKCEKSITNIPRAGMLNDCVAKAFQ